MDTATVTGIATSVAYNIQEYEPEKKLKFEEDEEDDDGGRRCNSDEEDDSDDEDFIAGGSLRKMTKEEDALYCKELRESGGFDVSSFPNVVMYGHIRPITVEYHKKYCDYLTDLAIKHYNKEQQANLQLVRIIKANAQAAAPMNYYITFEARNIVQQIDEEAKDADHKGPIKTFQALAYERIPLSLSGVSFVRLKPGQ